MITLTNIIMWVAYFIGLFTLVFWLIVFFEKGVIHTYKKLKRHPFVSIAVPAYNEESTIEETIYSLLKLDYPKNLFEVIVVNDGSNDKTKEIVENVISREKEFNIVLINQKNSGKGAGLNNALAKAKGEFFVCLDADSFITPDALQKILPVFEDDRKIGVVLPMMKVKNTNTFLQKMQWCEYIINNFAKKLMSYLDCCHVAPGPFSVYRKEIIQKLGGFSEDNLTEDLEMALRLQKHNYKLIQLLDTVVYTKIPLNLKGFFKQRNRWYKGSVLNVLKYRQMLFNKKYGDFGMFHLPTVLFAAIIALLVLVVSIYSYLFIPILRQIKNILAINFDVPMLMGKWAERVSFFNMNLMNIFLIVVVVLITLSIIYFAYKSHHERLAAHKYVPLIGYFFIYSILILLSWAWVFFDLARGKVQKW
ncbi:MAG: glycosyltransferase [Candidatus Nanoarchaeia archaeon]|nr:glycosyltransferase [Candidatus Nanoarchaeia archaeon]